MVDAWVPYTGFDRYELFRLLVESRWEDKYKRNGYYAGLLEKVMVARHGFKYGVAVSSGGAGIEALLVYYRQKGYNTVVIPAVGFHADWMIPLMLGYRVYVVDTYIDEPLMHAEKLGKVLEDIIDGGNAKPVIMPIPYFGAFSTDWARSINEVAGKYGVPVVYDAAHCYGVVMGDYADTAVVSFYTTKMLDGDNAGIVLTNNDELYEALKLVRQYGRTGRKTVFVGGNYGLSELSAAYVLSGIPFAEKRMQLALEKYKDIVSKMPSIYPGFTYRYNGYVVSVPVRHRKEAEDALEKLGVPVWRNYIPRTIVDELYRFRDVVDTSAVYEYEYADAYKFVNSHVFVSPSMITDEMIDALVGVYYES